jgi:L-iditol 2-dehydrogenase
MQNIFSPVSAPFAMKPLLSLVLGFSMAAASQLAAQDAPAITNGKPRIEHTVDMNNDIHYRLQCYQATHGSGMHGIRLAHQMLAGKHLPQIHRMTYDNERFHHSQILKAIYRAADSDSLKIIINWED